MLAGAFSVGNNIWMYSFISCIWLCKGSVCNNLVSVFLCIFKKSVENKFYDYLKFSKILHYRNVIHIFLWFGSTT
jgi:hypothetical protein